MYRLYTLLIFTSQPGKLIKLDAGEVRGLSSLTWDHVSLGSARKQCDGFVTRRKMTGVSSTRSMSLMSSAASGYVDADTSSASDLIVLDVRCINGEGCMVTLSGSTLGWEVYLAVSKQLPPKKGGRIILHRFDSRIILHQTLHGQGIVGKAATLSCTYVPTNLYAAWCCITGLPVPEKELALEGVTRVEGIKEIQHLQHQLPKSLEHLTFDDHFNQSLKQLALPEGLKSLTFGNGFDQSLDQVTLPKKLQTLTFGSQFNHSLEQVTLPNSLQTLTFGFHFNQSLEQVTLPDSLQSMTFFQQELATGYSAQQSSVFDIWGLFLSKFGTCCPAKQSSEFDIWQRFRSEFGKGDPAQQSSDFDIRPRL